MISIVIVTYNSEKYIYECLDSILNHVKKKTSNCRADHTKN